MSIPALELDLEVFSGPFDLLLALILREEVDLLEVDLAGVVLAYLAHVEARGELDLETATEFIALIAALLELKSRLMLPDEEPQELLEMGPQEAAEELLGRLLSAQRYKEAAGHLQALLAAEAGVRYRNAPVPRRLRRAAIEAAAGSGEAAILGEALGGLLRAPAQINVGHMSAPRVSVTERLEHLRALLRRGRFSFEDAVRRADRFTVAATLYALLELYRRGEADWEQPEAFGEITVSRKRPSGEREPKGSAEAPRQRPERLEVAV